MPISSLTPKLDVINVTCLVLLYAALVVRQRVCGYLRPLSVCPRCVRKTAISSRKPRRLPFCFLQQITV